MQALKIKVDGFMHSFRDPYFVDYHRTLLFPPKTTIVGLIVNAMGLEEEDLYKLQNDIYVAIILENFLAKGFDLWSTRKGKEKGEEPITQPIQREFLFKPKYLIYISCPPALLEKIEEAFRRPRRYYSLGRDDEVMEIKEDSKVRLEKSREKEFKCILPFDIYQYHHTQKILKNPIVRPEVVKLPLKFEKSNKGRIGKNIKNFTQFWGMKIILNKEIEDNCFKVIEDEENIILF